MNNTLVRITATPQNTTGAPMKFTFTLLLMGLACSQITQALEVGQSLETPLHSSEKMAFDNAQLLIKEIASGKNDDAMGEAAIECPQDNLPTFEIDNTLINTYWLPSAQSSSQKHFSATINYTLKCSHDRSTGGDR